MQGKTRLYSEESVLGAALRNDLKSMVKILDGDALMANARARFQGELFTPLMGAARQGHLAMATLLVERGADVNLGDRYGRTPLLETIRFRHSELACMLVSNGADLFIHPAPDTVSHDPILQGSMLAMAAGCRMSQAVVPALLDLPAVRAVIDEPGGREGLTPLMGACKTGSGDVVLSLLAHGAADTVWDKHGKRPSFISNPPGRKECLAWVEFFHVSGRPLYLLHKVWCITVQRKERERPSWAPPLYWADRVTRGDDLPSVEWLGPQGSHAVRGEDRRRAREVRDAVTPGEELAAVVRYVLESIPKDLYEELGGLMKPPSILPCL